MLTLLQELHVYTRISAAGITLGTVATSRMGSPQSKQRGTPTFIGSAGAGIAPSYLANDLLTLRDYK